MGTIKKIPEKAKRKRYKHLLLKKFFCDFILFIYYKGKGERYPADSTENPRLSDNPPFPGFYVGFQGCRITKIDNNHVKNQKNLFNNYLKYLHRKYSQIL